jgi:transposase InsO family protein
MLEYQRNEHTVTETAIRYHLSRKTVYKWRKRWDGTAKSLMDQSRRPKSSPKKQTEDEIRLVKRQAKKYKWQDHILAYQGAMERGYTRCFGCFTKTVRKLLDQKPKRTKKKRKNKPYQRADYPGQKVQVDVKYVPSSCVTDGRKYYQYTAVDECSRWTYRYMYDEHSTESSIQFLHRLVKEAPFQIKRIQTDNGNEWTKQLTSNDPRNLTSFELGLKAYGIEYQRIRVATPRHNGKVERQHRIDQARFYKSLRMFSLLDGRQQLAEYQRKSNDYIKGCLGMKSPNQIVEMYLGVM